MRHYKTRLEGITFSPSGRKVARFTHGDEFVLQPGQAVLSYKPGDWQPLRKALFPTHIYSNGFIADAPPEPSWQIGDTLDSLGPLGKGFTPPLMTKKWLLTSFGVPPDKVLALLQPGIERGVSIAICADQLPANLPPQVEWVTNLGEALSWADYLALDIPLEMLPTIRSKLGLSSGGQFPFPAQVLISQVLPCGIGACYACAVKSKHGLVLACTDGPVFDINQLEI